MTSLLASYGSESGVSQEHSYEIVRQIEFSYENMVLQRIRTTEKLGFKGKRLTTYYSDEEKVQHARIMHPPGTIGEIRSLSSLPWRRPRCHRARMPLGIAWQSFGGYGIRSTITGVTKLSGTCLVLASSSCKLWLSIRA